MRKASGDLMPAMAQMDTPPYGALDGPEDGTVSPTGAISSVTFEPAPAVSLARLAL